MVSNWTGIPVTRLNESESARLLTLEETLHARVVGQEDAVQMCIRDSKAMGVADVFDFNKADFSPLVDKDKFDESVAVTQVQHLSLIHI